MIKQGKYRIARLKTRTHFVTERRVNVICTKPLSCTRYQRLLAGRKLRKPVEEDGWKAVCGKAARTV
ncbi:MAG: hypothetical protein A2069_00240 [Planctomycetes bacterium GWB2_41_19]|nr:MAG: hypothetical protein A2069_00240 [Planctomycetes bacterium GWB2_41_19]